VFNFRQRADLESRLANRQEPAPSQSVPQSVVIVCGNGTLLAVVPTATVKVTSGEIDYLLG